jgi:hypothetical protein
MELRVQKFDQHIIADRTDFNQWPVLYTHYYHHMTIVMSDTRTIDILQSL